MINKQPFQNVVDKLKEEGKYRVFNDIVRDKGNFPKATWYSPYSPKTIVNWCSNDYLGMGQNKYVIDAMQTALLKTGSVVEVLAILAVPLIIMLHLKM